MVQLAPDERIAQAQVSVDKLHTGTFRDVAPSCLPSYPREPTSGTYDAADEGENGDG